MYHLNDYKNAIFIPMQSIVNPQKIFMHFSKKTIGEILRYILVSLGGYIFIFFFLYLLINILKLNKSIAYFVIYAFVYLFDYLITLKYVFRRRHKNTIILKYFLQLATFFLLNNLLFNSLIYFGIQYMIATVVVIIILFPIRFFTKKFIVYT
jgi:putative flippase GtrA